MTDIKKAKMRLRGAKMLRAKALFDFLILQTYDEVNDEYHVSFEDAALCIAELRPLKYDEAQPWPYPPETRPGVPVWFRQKIGIDWSPWVFHPCPPRFLLLQQNTEAVSADPRNPQEPPKNV